MNEEGEGVLEGEVRLEVEEKTVDEEGMVSFVESKSKAPVLSPSSPGIGEFTKRVYLSLYTQTAETTSPEPFL